MATKRLITKRPRERSQVKTTDLPEVALAAIASYKRQKEVSDFINFMLEALERNSTWLNSIVGQQENFRCALMTGCGPNRFQIQEIIYPAEEHAVKLDIELTETDDGDKVALTAILKLSSPDMENLLKYIKTRLFDNPILKSDLLRGKSLGVTFAVLRAFSDRQYRIVERIPIGPVVKNVEVNKKRRRDEKFLEDNILRKTKRRNSTYAQ